MSKAQTTTYDLVSDILGSFVFTYFSLNSLDNDGLGSGLPPALETGLVLTFCLIIFKTGTRDDFGGHVMLNPAVALARVAQKAMGPKGSWDKLTDSLAIFMPMIGGVLAFVLYYFLSKETKTKK